jgi:hypothetical protein
MRVRYTLRARADLDAIHSYLHERNPYAARRVIATIHERIAALAEWPRQAPVTDDKDIHVLPLPVQDLLRGREGHSHLSPRPARRATPLAWTMIPDPPPSLS